MASRIGDILVEMNILDRKTIEDAVTKANDAHLRIGDYLARSISLEEPDLYRALAKQQGIKFGSADDLYPMLDTKLMESFSLAYLQRHRVVPIKITDKTVTVATCDPDVDTEELRTALHAEKVEVIMLTPTDFTRLWTDLRMHAQLEDELDIPVEKDKQDDLVVAEFHQQARLVGFFGAILLDALGQRATDIHFEGYAEQVRLRFRIDGALFTITKFAISNEDYRGLVNIIKIQSQLDITEHRRPQGGRFRKHAGDTPIDLRVQTQPTLFGENIIIRILPHTQRRFSINELGFTPGIANRYERILKNPSGLVLFVGPTGSGKTTSLYAGLSILAEDDKRKVITIEDPIEYSIDDVQQTQISDVTGYSFATAMRVIVREDPDAILLGEIRDPETALEAVRASQTGHLVLSTLHCNDAVDAVQRLHDLGLHPNSISAELQGIYAQRLAPRICKNCSIVVAPDKRLSQEIFPEGIPDNFKTFRCEGCDRCQQRGTFGRIAIIEYLPVSAALRQDISKRVGVDELRSRAIATGLVPLRDIALSLVNKGVIDYAFLPRMLLPERLPPDRPDQPFLEDPDVLITGP